MFRNSYWLLDVVVCSALGGLLGYILQLETSSDSEDPGSLLLLGTVVGVFSYVVAGAVGFGLSRKTWRLPSWLWVLSIGTALFVIGHAAVLVAWKGVNPNDPATTTQQMVSFIFVSSMPGELIKLFLLFGCIFLFVLMMARFLTFLVYRVYLLGSRLALK